MEKRLDRLEDKVDKIDDIVVEIKTDMKHYNKKIDQHLDTDASIIKTISPLLQKLPQIVEIAEQYQFEKQLKERLEADSAMKSERVKSVSMKLGIVATLTAIVTGILRIL